MVMHIMCFISRQLINSQYVNKRHAKQFNSENCSLYNVTYKRFTKIINNTCILPLNYNFIEWQ